MTRLDVNSKFYIDLGYWKSQGRDFREELYDELCEDCRRLYSLDEPRQVDRIDPVTGQVERWDAIWECAVDQCGRAPDFVNPKMPMTRAIMRAFIANGNAPLSAVELHNRIGKGSPQIILKELISPDMELEGFTPVEN
jgi:hypothetical protein